MVLNQLDDYENPNGSVPKPLEMHATISVCLVGESHIEAKRALSAMHKHDG